MVEISLNWLCPKCRNAQGKLLRFKEDLVSEREIVIKSRKTRLECRFCREKFIYERLPQESRLNVSNTQEKKSAKYNEYFNGWKDL